MADFKSRFIEMFGDPLSNSQRRPTKQFIDVVTMQRGFDLPVKDRDSSGIIPVYGSNGIVGFHSVAKAAGPGIVTGRSGTIGKVTYVENDYWPLNTSLFSKDVHGNNAVYLKYLVDMFDLTRFTAGAGVPTLNRNLFHSEQIIDVPIGEQDEFADFVAKVDKLEFSKQKANRKRQCHQIRLTRFVFSL